MNLLCSHNNSRHLSDRLAGFSVFYHDSGELRGLAQLCFVCGEFFEQRSDRFVRDLIKCKLPRGLAHQQERTLSEHIDKDLYAFCSRSLGLCNSGLLGDLLL